jgi:hypothetical protein
MASGYRIEADIKNIFFISLFIYSYVHTLFGSFLHPVPLPSSVSGRSHSALVTDFVEEKT